MFKGYFLKVYRDNYAVCTHKNRLIEAILMSMRDVSSGDLLSDYEYIQHTFNLK